MNVVLRAISARNTLIRTFGLKAEALTTVESLESLYQAWISEDRNDIATLIGYVLEYEKSK